MSATYTLATTNLTYQIDAVTDRVTLNSVAGILPGMYLYLIGNGEGDGGELLKVYGILPGMRNLQVGRGQHGTITAQHCSGSQLWIGTGDQFYDVNPMGTPPETVLVNPWINVLTGDVWYAYGDESPAGNTVRWWQRQSSTQGIGDLGIRTIATVGAQ